MLTAHKWLCASSTAALLAFLVPDATAQCLLDRALPSGETLPFGTSGQTPPRFALSGDWLAYGNSAADGVTYVVDFFERGAAGTWDWSQAISLPTDGFTTHHIGLDGEFAVIATGSEIQSYRLDPLNGQWQAEGTPFSTPWVITEFDYDHPNVILANPFYDISFIFLNGEGRILERQPSGDFVAISGFSGFPLDQFAGDGVAVAGDLVAYGASGFDGFGKADPGFVRVFRIDPSSPGGLEFLVELTDPMSTSTSDFGSELAMSEDYLAVQSGDGEDFGSETGERIVMHRFEAGTFVFDGVIPVPAGWTAIGDGMALSGDTLVVTVSLFSQAPRALVYQRLQGNWVLRTALDEPENVLSSLDVAADAQRAVTATSVLQGPNGVSAAAWIWDFSGFECSGLVTSPNELSISQGGEVDWLTSLAPNAAGDLFLIVGTASGTTPGVPLGSLTVPLNVDDWSLFTLSSANQGPLQGTFGVLDALGGATSRLTLPGGANPALAGTVLHQAALTLDPITGAPTGVSAASALTLTP